MEIVIDFNDGLSLISPTSCFVKFKESGFQIDGAYNNIIEKDIPDIIFYGKLVENIEDLKWLTPRLIAEGYTVSYVANMKTIHKLIDLPTNFIILKIELIDLKGAKNLELIKSLKPIDVVLYTGGFDKLKPFLNMIDTKARLFYENIVSSLLIDAGIYNMGINRAVDLVCI